MSTLEQSISDWKCKRVREILRLLKPADSGGTRLFPSKKAFKEVEAELIKLLPTIDVNTTIRTNDQSLLMYYMKYAIKPSIVVLEQFIKCGAGVNSANRHGSVTHVAISRKLKNVVQVVQLLIDSGSDPRLRDSSNRSCVDLAIKRFESDFDTRCQVLVILLGSPFIEIDFNLLDKLLKEPDAIFEVLKSPNEGLRTLLQDECRNLHRVIDWNAAGYKKLDLFILLVDVYQLDINAEEVVMAPISRIYIKSYENDAMFDYAMKHPKLNLKVLFNGLTPLEYAIANDNYEVAVKLVKAGFKLRCIDLSDRKFCFEDNFVSLSKLITMKGGDYRDYFDVQEKNYFAEFWKSLRNELDLLNHWIQTIPSRRGTLMELATLKLRQRLSGDDIMELIGYREVDLIVKFFAFEALERV